jgi:hypothetical protein
MKALGVFVAWLALSVIAIAFTTFDAYVGIEWIAGHDISFREAVGAGFLLFVASGGSAAVGEAVRS